MLRTSGLGRERSRSASTVSGIPVDPPDRASLPPRTRGTAFKRPPRRSCDVSAKARIVAEIPEVAEVRLRMCSDRPAAPLSFGS